MKLIPTSPNREEYLACTPLVDYDHPQVAALAKQLGEGETDPFVLGRKCYHFVRDEIGHSWDVKGHAVPATASETLLAGEGICFAKSMLLASLLRYHGIPTGFCYQRLRLGAVPGKYCIHALNGVYLTPPGDWIRQDARGRRPNREAEFSNVKEILPCHPDPAKEEVDYPFLLPHPPPGGGGLPAPEHRRHLDVPQRFAGGTILSPSPIGGKTPLFAVGKGALFDF